MKKAVFFITFFALILRGVTTAQNPFESIGKTAKVLTLSNGKYQEIFPNDTLVPIGSVMYNTITGKVVAFLTRDTMYAEYNLEPELVSRWLSPDPLGAKHPELSPYTFVNNNPIIYVDPDGQDYILVINHDTRTVTIQATYYTKKGDADSYASAQQSASFWNDKSGNYQYNVGKGDDKTSYSVNFNLTVKEVDNPLGEANKDRQDFTDASLKSTPDKSSNTYSVLADSDKKFESGEEGKSTNATTTGGSVINVKDSRKSTETGAHEVGHTLGLEHYSKGVLTATSNDPNRSSSITGGYVKDLIKNGLKGKSEAGNVYLRQVGTAPDNFKKGKVEEVKK